MQVQTLACSVQDIFDLGDEYAFFHDPGLEYFQHPANVEFEAGNVVGVICGPDPLGLLRPLFLNWTLVSGSLLELTVTANCAFVHIELFCNGAVRFSGPDAARDKLATLVPGQFAHDRAHCPYSVQRRAPVGLVA